MTASPVATSTSPVTQTLRAPNRVVSFGVILAVSIIEATTSGSIDSAATSGLSPRVRGLRHETERAGDRDRGEDHVDREGRTPGEPLEQRAGAQQAEQGAAAGHRGPHAD